MSAVCIDAFSASVARTLSKEGIDTFLKITAGDAFLERMNQDNLMLVAECNDSVIGSIELKQGNNVAMLFVHPDHQNKGIGKRLVSSVLRYARVTTVQ